MGGAPSFRFIGGKGGVGKTTCAAAIAVASASAGRRTLLVSTDPAPSLAAVLRHEVGATPRRVPAPRGWLAAVEIHASRALAKWLRPRTRTLEEIALRGTWLDREDVSRILAQSLPGIDEIAALLELARFAASPRYDHIVVDTAPTGHTLRMLAMPETLRGLARVFDDMQAKHRAMAAALRGTWRGDEADALIEEIDANGRELSALLRDAARVRMTWVTLPEPMAIEETRDAIEALSAEGIRIKDVVVNRLTPAPPEPCRWCDARRRFERRALGSMQARSADLSLTGIEARPGEPRGVRALLAIGRELETPLDYHRGSGSSGRPPVRAVFQAGDRRSLLPVTEATGLLLFGGKGGVGKTTCAAAAALELASAFPQHRLLLLSTDPAHSLADALGQKLSDQPRALRGGPPNLEVRELDAGRIFAAVRERYAGAIDAVFDRLTRRSAFDVSHDRRVMHDLIDLAPPGVDELVAVTEVTELIASLGSRGYNLVIMDTAPSGHALRLLEMPAIAHGWVKTLMSILLKYQPVVGAGDLGALLVTLSRALGRLRVLLADPVRTRFVAVTRPGALPVGETQQLLERLKGLNIYVPLVVVNAVGAGTCSYCSRVRSGQRTALGTLQRRLRNGRKTAVALAPAMVPPPFGSAALRRWRKSWSSAG